MPLMSASGVVLEIRDIFFEGLEKKAGWGKNEVKTLLDDAIMVVSQRYMDKAIKMIEDLEAKDATP